MNQIDKMIGNIIGKPRVRGGKNDWDGDGVLNRKDCQPRNTMRQDASNESCPKCGTKMRDVGYYWCKNCGYEESYRENKMRK